MEAVACSRVACPSCRRRPPLLRQRRPAIGTFEACCAFRWLSFPVCADTVASVPFGCLDCPLFRPFHSDSGGGGGGAPTGGAPQLGGLFAGGMPALKPRGGASSTPAPAPKVASRPTPGAKAAAPPPVASKPTPAPAKKWGGGAAAAAPPVARCVSISLCYWSFEKPV